MADKNIKITYEVDASQLDKARAVLSQCAAASDRADKEVDKLGQSIKKAGDNGSDFGKKTDDGFKKPLGTIEKLKRQMIAFEKARDSSTDPKRIELLNRALEKSREKLKNLTTAAKEPEKSLSSLSKASTKLGASLAAAFTVGAVVAMGKKIFDITAEFQRFEAVLTNTLGSSVQAQGAMSEIATAAAQTNFSVQELTDSYIKFANRGVKLSQAELIKLSDIANSTGKSFDQLTEAVLDSFTGENERLKEFGITAKKTGETTQFTFKGVTTEVKNTQAAISQYLFSLAELNGVQGSTAAISQTLEGRVSNLGDAFDQLFLNIGKATTGFLPGLISKFTDFINVIALSFKSLKQIQQEANALNLSGDLREDIDEVSALRDAYVKNGADISEATRKAAASVITSLSNLKHGWNVLTAEEEANINERIANIKKMFPAQKESVDSELGLLEKLRKELKEVTDQREKSTSEKEIQGYNRRAKQIQVEIDRLLGVEKQAQRTRAELEKLAGIDYTTGLTEFGVKMKATLGDVYGKLYGEQVTGAGKATEANEKQTNAFIQNISDRINAKATELGIDEENRFYQEQRDKESYDRRVKLAQEFVNAANDLYGSIVAYQNQADEIRVTNFEAQRERELAAAGNNAEERNKIELNFDNRIKEIRRRQAEREKRLAIFQAIINVAQGVTAALKLGIPGIILAAVVAAAGAVQIAAISSQPIPAYNKGVKGVPGVGDRDTVQAKLTPGEWVIPKGTVKKYKPVLNAIFDNKIDPRILNDIAKGKSGGSVFINDNREIVEELRKIKPGDKFSFDEDGFTRYQERGSSRTKYIEKRYRAK